MILWAVDIGKKGGMTIITKANDGGLFEAQAAICFPIECKDLNQFYDFLRQTVIKYGAPEIVISGKPNRMYNIVLAHAQYLGVLGLVARVPVWLENDNTMRKEILGAGNGNKKDMVHAKYQGETEDVSDSMLFADYALKMINKGSR